MIPAGTAISVRVAKMTTPERRSWRTDGDDVLKFSPAALCLRLLLYLAPAHALTLIAKPNGPCVCDGPSTSYLDISYRCRQISFVPQ